MGLMDKVKGMLGQNPDKAQTGIDKTGDFIDDKTGSKYADKVDKGQETLGKRFGRGERRAKGEEPGMGEGPGRGEGQP